MRLLSTVTLVVVSGCYMAFVAGCKQEVPSPTPVAEHDHDGADHDGHDHDEHDHDGHDHDGHDHDEHDHAIHIDAAELGLSTDDLVSLDESIHPDNLKDAVAVLQTMHETIRDGFANDDVDAAHGPLHEVGHLLEMIESTLESASLSDTQQASAKEAVKSLFDEFGSIDGNLHDDKPADYDAYAEKIDAAMKKLLEVSSDTKD
ncbi:hypothetical protein CA13_30830 [Planctomycetes bacterium CA13]|uniref:Uncharacterized protein n=1 Tax=Novipirellula herctigrandis TaxID=2527986 RepID=A0A5C5Z384_9BACT|nr:hypothetical protein CA13_30830 [Planctomycetes bacterium CA13]